MLKRMLLINSANFQFADIDLSKEIFFVGDNASGKTTTTRALHFLYNGDGQKLAIPRSKDSFAKHYFPNDDSYIIYVFESFFIFTYKRNDIIRRWFSKQEFNLNKIIKNETLVDFKEIESYIKDASLKIKPKSIEEYTSILYGHNKNYLDFSIGKIEYYKIFLELFNMIFNIDKAIVTSSDIKKAIQKSLDRKDEVLSIDYEDFINKLNSFSKSYNFFKIFDNNRKNLKNALSLKDNLLLLEKDEIQKQKEISYRYQFEISELNKLNDNICQHNAKIKIYKQKIKNIEKFYDMFENRLSGKIDILNKEIIKLEILKEKFDPIEVEEKIIIANRYDGIKKELDDKKYSLQKLKEKQTTVQKEIENQIEQINYKIKFTIPNETTKSIYDLSEIEKNNYENDKLEIDKEYATLTDEINNNIGEIKTKINNKQEEKNGIDLYVLEKQNTIKKDTKSQIEPLETQNEINKNNILEIDKRIRKLKLDKEEKDILFQQHNDKYKNLRVSNAKILSSKRRLLNNKILNARAILNPIKNSFNEFLSNEIDGWEKIIYPIVDKNLLTKSCDELKPKIIDSQNPIGFEIDTNNLDLIPTGDEALEIIKKVRIEKFTLLKDSREIYIGEISKLDEEKNRLLSDIEICNKKIDNLIDDKLKLKSAIEKSDNKIDTISEKQITALEKIDKQNKQKKEEIVSKIDSYEHTIKTFNLELQDLRKKQNLEKIKSAKDRDENIKIIKIQENDKQKQKLKIEQEKIKKLQNEIKTIDEDDMISNLDRQVSSLDKDSINSYDARTFIEEYEKSKNDILQLPKKEDILNKQNNLYKNRKALVKKIDTIINTKISNLNDDKVELESMLKKYDLGTKKVKSLNIEILNKGIETEEFLIDLLNNYEDIQREYRNNKSKFRENIDKLKKLELHSLIELNFNIEIFSEVKSIAELENIIDSLSELDNFEKNKYESEKKRSHNNFKSFLNNTIPSKLKSFDDLEDDFEKAKFSINKSLSHANFGVIRDIKLITNSSKNRNDTISALLQSLLIKAKDTIGLYSKNSLFYHDVPKSVGNIADIQSILEEIKKKGSNGSINLFDTIDLSISYIENGKKIENKLNIKDESSSGGNILLKVAIAMSILSRYAKKTKIDTPFFLIIDEVSKLQSKNQSLIREYINNNGFKTLFITPDPAYPDPDKAIYYTFKNIQEDGETLEINQMNIV